MARLSGLASVERLYRERGGRAYGEGVSQIEHALQCASLAQADGAAPSLIVAALVHDIGHLFEDEDAPARDHRHEAVGAAALAGLFDEAVCAPIALHVAAKRYLCFRERRYFAALSPASQASLGLQGGAFDAAQAAAFRRLAYWREAVALRRLDDVAKSQEACGRNFFEFLPVMRAVATAGAL
ncbi:MAG TPA: HD domain-containing protein [Caulobacteraceae bacterium]